jgi:hypothetical protein
VTPLPGGADAVVLDVAARAYSNPSNVQTQATGPYSATFGALGGGLWLTRQNKAAAGRFRVHHRDAAGMPARACRGGT